MTLFAYGEGDASRPRWRWTAARPQAGRGRHCRPGGHRNGSEPVSGPAACDDRRPVAGPDLASRRRRGRRSPSFVLGALAGFLVCRREQRHRRRRAPRRRSSPAHGDRVAPASSCPAGAVVRSGAARARWPSPPPSTAPALWCSAAAMSFCRCFGPPWSIRGGFPTAPFWPATAPPRPCRGRCSPLPPISARSPPFRRAALLGRRSRSLRSSRPDFCW